jgi:SAM-dependent methyltransferase
MLTPEGIPIMTTEPIAFYDDPDVLTRYLEARGRRDDGNRVIEEPHIRVMIPDMRRKRVLDLGCGDGRFARTAAREGAASFHGVDGSEAMLARARAGSGWAAATWECRNLESWEAGDSVYDLVVSRMALHYVVGLDRLLRAVRRALIEGGSLVFSVEHPMVTCHYPTDSGEGAADRWTVMDYFSKGPRRCHWLGADVWKQHRPLADYVGAVLADGFQLVSLSEGEPDSSSFGDTASYRSRKSIPAYLIVRALAV